MVGVSLAKQSGKFDRWGQPEMLERRTLLSATSTMSPVFISSLPSSTPERQTREDSRALAAQNKIYLCICLMVYLGLDSGVLVSA